MPDPAPSTDTRPWRKRHPVISRTLLYGLGLGLAVVLYVLFAQDQDEREDTRIAALQQELDNLSLVFATDPTGDAVLEQLDEKFSEPGLPVTTQGRALRWRAMVWRRRVAQAPDADAREAAVRKAEAALEACAALDLEPAERTALALEWTEARLERQDLEGAYGVMPAADDLTSVPVALLATLLRAQAQRLEGRVDEAAALARSAVTALGPALRSEQQAYVGGRTWTPAQVAVELAGFATTVGDPAEVRAAWNKLRAAAPSDFEVQIAAARGLAKAGAGDDAAAAWRSAKAINGDMADSEARRDETLQALEAGRIRR